MTLTVNANRSKAAAIWITSLVTWIHLVTRALLTDLPAEMIRAARWPRTDIPIGLHQTSEALQAAAMTATAEMDHPRDTRIYRLKLASVQPSSARMLGLQALHIKLTASLTTRVKSGLQSSRKQVLQLGAVSMTTVTTDSPAMTASKSSQHHSSSILLRCAAISS